METIVIATRYPELTLDNPMPRYWRFCDAAWSREMGRPSHVGPIYPTKTEALADLESYARRGGWIKD